MSSGSGTAMESLEAWNVMAVRWCLQPSRFPFDICLVIDIRHRGWVPVCVVVDVSLQPPKKDVSHFTPLWSKRFRYEYFVIILHPFAEQETGFKQFCPNRVDQICPKPWPEYILEYIYIYIYI